MESEDEKDINSVLVYDGEPIVKAYLKSYNLGTLLRRPSIIRYALTEYDRTECGFFCDSVNIEREVKCHHYVSRSTKRLLTFSHSLQRFACEYNAGNTNSSQRIIIQDVTSVC